MNKPLLKVLVAFDIFLVAGGLIGAGNLLFDKTGKSLDADTSWLEKTPVTDFFLPGLFILFAYVICPLLCIVLMKRARNLALMVNGLVGVILVLWVVYQFLVVPETIFVQYLMIGVGLVMAFCSAILLRIGSNQG